MNNVGHDGGGRHSAHRVCGIHPGVSMTKMDARLKMSGMTEGESAGMTAGGMTSLQPPFRHACATEVREREDVPSRHPSPAIRAPEQPRPPKMDSRLKMSGMTTGEDVGNDDWGGCRA